ncbi:MAG: hypothetical protein F6K47_04750 [Symploca sp. SIO2E6]|nr:hypothetical protein [Symploca sp. SIO2E6]
MLFIRQFTGDRVKLQAQSSDEITAKNSQMEQQNSSVTVSPQETLGVSVAGHRRGNSPGRLRTLLIQGIINKAKKTGRIWVIPTDGGLPKIIPDRRGHKGN